jgi:serine/threonine protein kinase
MATVSYQLFPARSGVNEDNDVGFIPFFCFTDSSAGDGMVSEFDQFIDRLGSSGLLPATEVRELVESTSEAMRPADVESLGKLLVESGRLTAYQAQAACSGAVNALVLGNYIVLDRLGAGGMGTVYKAIHRRMKRVVAVKVLARSVSQNASFLGRFQREVEAVARLNHPNVVQAFDADECEAGQFLVMEYVDGSDLASAVRDVGPMPVREAVDCMVQAARALEYAHGQGIVHRDIKPANLMRDSNGVVKLTDLGLARFNEAINALSGSASLVTQTGSITGTVDFMAPEQARNTKLADQRADIYSLGCTFYFLLTGQLPFHGETIMEKLLAHREQPAPSLRTSRADVSESIDQVFRRMLAKKPEDRFQSAAELIEAIGACEIPSGSSVDFLLGASLLPVDQIAPTTDVPPAPLAVDDLTIVLIEPSRTQSLVITGLLRQLGVQRINRFSEAIKALDAARAARPDIVISAMHLSEMTGIDLLKRLRADPALAKLPFLLVSSETDYPPLAQLNDEVRVAILPKPFDGELLNWTITRASQLQSPAMSTLTKLTLGGLTVLLVAHNADSRDMAHQVLGELGVRTIAEAPGEVEARELLDKRPFDLVVVADRDRIASEELLRFARQQESQRRSPVLIVKYAPDRGRVVAMQRLGAFVVCDQKFDADSLREVLVGMMARELPGRST